MKDIHFPSSEDVELELQREQYRLRYKRTLVSTVFALVTAAAAAVLVAALWLPVLEIFGASMTPTLGEGQYVVAVKDDTPQTGDIVAFYYGNKVLVKRCIAGPGAWIDIQEDGTVLVDGEVLDEPYLPDKHFGICDLELPFQVPEGTYFLMGDERETSVDSRHSSVGCISTDQFVGRIVYRVWPMTAIGAVH